MQKCKAIQFQIAMLTYEHLIFRKMAMHNFTKKVFVESTKPEGWIPLLVLIACIMFLGMHVILEKQNFLNIKYFRFYYLLFYYLYIAG